MALSDATQQQLDAARGGLADANLVDFAFVQNELEIAEPKPQALPCLWRWDTLKKWLAETYEGMSLAEVHRRTLALANPGFTGRPLATTTLFASISMYFPGDQAGVHRHTANASRFLLEGTGGFTSVGGEKLTMRRGDLVITPNGQWHDHGNDGAEPIVWVNVLDVALLERLNAIITEWDYSEANAAGVAETRTVQSIARPADHSQRLFGSGGLVPRFGPETRGGGLHSPMYIYCWDNTRDTLDRLRSHDGSPFDGIIVEYTDPVNGGSVVPTMSFRAQLLRPGETTRTHRHTTNTVYCALEGEGVTEVDGTELAWHQNDVFIVPGWMWHRHINASSADAVLYSVSDAPVHEKLGVYIEQEKSADGEVSQVVPWPATPPEHPALS